MIVILGVPRVDLEWLVSKNHEASRQNKVARVARDRTTLDGPINHQIPEWWELWLEFRYDSWTPYSRLNAGAGAIQRDVSGRDTLEDARNPCAIDKRAFLIGLHQS